MLILFIVVTTLMAVAAACAAGSAIYARIHIVRLLDNEQKTRRWRAIRVLSIVIAASAVALSLALFIVPQFMREILYGAALIAALALARYYIIVTATRDIRYYQKLRSERLASEDVSESGLHRYAHENLHTILKKKSLHDLAEGDNVEFRSSILMLDLTNRIASETILHVKERFSRIASWIQEAGMILYANDCIFIQITAYGLIAVCSSDSLAMIDATIKINQRIDELSSPNAQRGMVVPINYILTLGSVTMGTLSDGKVLQPILSSGAIDMADQIRRLMRPLHIPMVIDELSRRAHERLDKYDFRYMGEIHNKVSGQTIKTYEVLNLYPESQRQQFIANKAEFEEARYAHERGEFHKAYSQYTSIVSRHPSDLLAQHFQEQCNEVLARSVSDS